MWTSWSTCASTDWESVVDISIRSGWMPIATSCSRQRPAQLGQRQHFAQVDLVRRELLREEARDVVRPRGGRSCPARPPMSMASKTSRSSASSMSGSRFMPQVPPSTSDTPRGTNHSSSQPGQRGEPDAVVGHERVAEADHDGAWRVIGRHRRTPGARRTNRPPLMIEEIVPDALHGIGTQREVDVDRDEDQERPR